MSFLFVQFLTVLASASSLFLVASGLTLIFGVTRVVNFAHGSLYMLGAYCGYSFVGWLAPLLGDGLGFWLTVPLAAIAVAALGIGIEVTVLRRIRSEAHTSELQSLMRISYAVFCLQKKKQQ